MINVEFHCHTCYSKDSLTTPESVLETSLRKGIDKIVISDHNSIKGAEYASRLDPLRVIIGEEIMTTQGELLAFFVQEEIPGGLGPLEAIHSLRRQGAFISVSHPFDHYRSGHWVMENLTTIAPLVDAVEVYNARCIQSKHNNQAKEFAGQHGLSGTVGSDAHAALEIGKATMTLPYFKDKESLIQALGEATAHTSLSPPWIHFYSRYAVWRKKLGWDPG